MSLRLRRTLLASAISSLACGAVAAQETPQLNDIVVTASGFEQQISSAPASISVISREELERGHYQNVTDALRDVPGVVVTGGGAGDNGNDISIRGMPSQYTLILVDGRPQNSRESRPNGSAGFEQDWLPPLQAIERIEVVRGPMSTLYGSDAIGGVINVITRKVADTWHGNIQLDTVLQEDSASGDSRQANFYLSGPLVADRLGLQLYGRTSERDEDDIENGYEEKSLQSLTARLSLAASDNHDFTAEAGITEQDRRSLVGRSAPAEGCRGGCTDSIGEYTNSHVALTHSGRFEWGTSETFVQRERSENQSRDIEITNTTAKTSAVIPLGMHMLTVGASWEEESLEDGTTNQISDRTAVENSQWALFMEDEWMLTDAWALTGGLRLDDDDNYGSHLSPRLYSVWKMTPEWTLKGGVSTGYRSPNLREITPDWGQISRGGNVYGNPDLEPETSLNKEIALLYGSDAGLNGSLTLFHNDFEDKITRIACPINICNAGPNQFGSDPTYRVNIDDAVTQGVEASLSAPLSDTLALTASYTFTDSEQKSGEYAGEPLTQLPRHQVSATLDWDVNARLSQWTKVSYRGEESQPTTGPSQSSIVAPSYTFVDAGIGYQLNDSTTVNAGIYNLFDERITYDEYGYVDDGRRVWLGLNVAF
ncbi:ligand-gated channel protein [Vreelandella aquamarina]|jgi:outer membrane receptor for ferrienterochelin and colicins|uniref:Ligand-gated channel protein n=1 Tax=Vreelandella aquamarina TaxID=77097 RepID=A0A6F8SX44_9GAMM|nr:MULTISPECIES: ligand-gated channel protein [Halomonas]MEC9021127.1 ligand-gated channel protein [Pseudomonadota bacterium]MCC4289645.1 ligand-gated channel protein [Halomonas axialensis]MCD1652979.1 ligand-gated channel protein [Halomonas axialensis]MCD2089316.1 ligand-gated channel protein [Halomonas meridiana]MCF2913776.1 ligand-gated channel protein [Halomonas sp. Cn5-12]